MGPKRLPATPFPTAQKAQGLPRSVPELPAETSSPQRPNGYPAYILRHVFLTCILPLKRARLGHPGRTSLGVTQRSRSSHAAGAATQLPGKVLTRRSSGRDLRVADNLNREGVMAGCETRTGEVSALGGFLTAWPGLRIGARGEGRFLLPGCRREVLPFLLRRVAQAFISGPSVTGQLFPRGLYSMSK